ncbi:MAG: hypothetical protein WAL67_17015 [Candidatus Cybelea sp.]
MQYVFGGLPEFGTKLPKGSPLVSTQLVPKKRYTVWPWVKAGPGDWLLLTSCYVVAQTSKYGGALEGISSPLEGEFFRHKTGVIEILSGALVSNKC